MEFTYKGLQGTLSRRAVTDEEVERQIQRLVQQNPRINLITDRPTQAGDEIVLDYAGFCNGEQFAGGTAQNQTLVLGSGAFIPGFEAQLLGKHVGQEVTVEVTFPAGYHAEALAGKPAQFKCTIHAIQEKAPAEADDAFARQFAGCDSMEHMRQQLRQSMQDYSDYQGEMDLQDQLLRQAAETLDYTPSQQELDAAVEQQMQNLEGQLAAQGLTMDMYCSFMQTDRNALAREAVPAAQAALRQQAAVQRIVLLEGLEAQPQELEKAIEGVCRQNGMTRQELEPYMDQGFTEALKQSVLTGMVMRLVRDAAQITEV